jgi:hypothetical protein
LRNKHTLGLNLILKFVVEEVDCDFIRRWLEDKVSVLKKRKKARITRLLSPRLKTRIWSDEQPHALCVGPPRLGRCPPLVDRYRCYLRGRDLNEFMIELIIEIGIADVIRY